MEIFGFVPTPVFMDYESPGKTAAQVSKITPTYGEPIHLFISVSISEDKKFN